MKTKKSRNLKGILRGKVIAFAVYMVVARIKNNEPFVFKKHLLPCYEFVTSN